MTRIALLPILWLLVGASPSMAVEWADALWNKTSHNFGTVARGAVVQYRFTIENIYVEDVHIQSVRSSCGCTSPTLNKDTLKTGEKAELLVQLDTQRFKGTREATITVKLDRPFPADVQLKVYAYIRSDVVIQPGSVQFGSVRQGATASRQVSITYAGRQDWQVVDVIGPHCLEAKLTEVGRAQDAAGPNWQVTYNLDLTLKSSAPPGLFVDRLMLRTNDPNQQAAQVPLTVEALVLEALSASPSPLVLGMLRPKQSVNKVILVKGEKPFRILEVTGPDDRFQATLPTQTADIHRVLLRFTAGGTPGRVTGKVRIKTDLPGAPPVEVAVDGNVVDDAATGSGGWTASDPRERTK
ncbi:MAG: DUF1573 domain-containing protein [Thermoguttaceae bacterium]